MKKWQREEDKETRFARLRFEEILHALTASTKENIEEKEREQLMELRKGVAKVEIDRVNRILEKHLGNTKNICIVVDAVYATSYAMSNNWGMKKIEAEWKKEVPKNQEEPQIQKRKYKNLKSILSSVKKWGRSWFRHQMKIIEGKQLKRKRRFCKNWKHEQTKNWIGMKS